ncbi:hypothetical protein R5R35_008008 [Gryllus longicercus]|uniref:Uncharacterized protein n=1 Tax=Gryllus longicercus TaxID=2509291 RepID=A0AAN9VDQ7_9ORTH
MFLEKLDDTTCLREGGLGQKRSLEVVRWRVARKTLTGAFRGRNPSSRAARAVEGNAAGRSCTNNTRRRRPSAIGRFPRIINIIYLYADILSLREDGSVRANNVSGLRAAKTVARCAAEARRGEARPRQAWGLMRRWVRVRTRRAPLRGRRLLFNCQSLSNIVRRVVSLSYRTFFYFSLIFFLLSAGFIEMFGERGRERRQNVGLYYDTREGNGNTAISQG